MNAAQTKRTIDAFTRAYIETALWSSNDESDERGGEPMDANYSVDDLSDEAIERMARDCTRFRELAGENIHGLDETTVAHDFWLTRNGHGAGFWDGDYEQTLGDDLTRLSETFGACWLGVGDDGTIYHYPA